MKKYNKPQNDGSMVFGIIILGIGIILLLRKMGLFIPGWILSWPMILIAIGTFSLVKNEFKSLFGFIMVLIGTFFLLKREFDLEFGIGQYIWPIGLIILGIYLITQKKKENKALDEIWKNWGDEKKTTFSPGSSKVEEAQVVDDQGGSGSTQTKEDSGFTRTTGTSFADRITVDAIFSGVNRKVMSKNFQGGKITAAFGGADLDLTQVDFNGVITIQLDIIFGGVKLIVPPHWDIRTEVTNIAAGLEDKRYFRDGGVDPTKVVVLKGTILFGGLEIKSF
jgi:predicted membrane protein